MALDPIKQYFGIITLYDGQNEYGYIQCHEIGNIKYKLCHLLKADDVIKLIKNALFYLRLNKIARINALLKKLHLIISIMLLQIIRKLALILQMQF